MAWLAVNKNREEVIFNNNPDRSRENYFYSTEEDLWDEGDSYLFAGVFLPKGTIEKLIGHELTWEDDPVEI